LGGHGVASKPVVELLTAGLEGADVVVGVEALEV
jgi:hypothetical protein